jgi:hypothetical protein
VTFTFDETGTFARKPGLAAATSCEIDAFSVSCITAQGGAAQADALDAAPGSTRPTWLYSGYKNRGIDSRRCVREGGAIGTSDEEVAKPAIQPCTLTEYVARHAPDHVTEAMDEVCAEIGSEADSFVSAASRRIPERSEW